MNRKILALSLALLCGGCASISQLASEIAVSTSSSTPSQVTTLADAERAATLATKAVDIVVQTGKLNRATLTEIGQLNDGLHSALVSLEAANSAKQSLTFAAFNAALAAFNSYATNQGIAH